MKTSTIISNSLDNATIAYMMLKTRMTMGPNNSRIAECLDTLYINLDALIEETTPEWFTDEEIEWVTEASSFLFQMSNDPEWSNFFVEEESENE